MSGIQAKDAPSPFRAWIAGFIAVAAREWRSMLATPLGWSVLAAFAALAGTVFALAVFQSGAPATLRGVFVAMGWAVLATAPALSMRSVAEEKRHGTWASLLAAPAGCSAAIAGKFAAALAFLALAVLLPTLAQVLALELFARPDYGEVLTAVLGLLLAGAAYIASGILMSALTGNQVGAYLLTLFFWLTWVVVAKALPAVLAARAAYVAFAFDPLRRLDDSLLGLLDTGNIAFFSCAAAWFLFAAVLCVMRTVQPARLAGGGRTALALGAAALLVAGIAGSANAPAARAMLDMTKTRAYTLAPGTERLIRDLTGEWTVGVVIGSAGADPAVLRQIDEVLARMSAESGGKVRTLRVDPTEPADAARYEQVLEAVQARDAAALAKHASAVAAGLAAFDRLAQLAVGQLGELAAVLQTLPPDSPDRAELEPLRAAFAQLAAQKGAFDRSIRELRTATDARPFPDESRAAAAIAANLRHWGEQLQGAARALGQRAHERVDSPTLAAWLERAVPLYMDSARDLRAGQDSLEQLPRLYGSAVGAALAAGDAILVIGPPGISVIPGWQLVSGGGARGSVAFDRRFRGEQLVAAAIRGMRSGSLPAVVFMHSGAPGILRARPDHADLAAAADALRAARFDVSEWIPGEGAEPAAPSGRPLVWVIVPPPERDGTNETPRERALLAAAERIIARGEPVLISVGPSLMPLLGQTDPWAALLNDRGAQAQTGRSVLEVVPLGPGRAQIVAEQQLRDFDTRHPIGSAVDGQLMRLDRVVPIELTRGTGVVLAAVDPAAERWIENDWRRDQRQRLEAPEGKTFNEPVPVVVALEGAQGAVGKGGNTRAVLVGSPSWLGSQTADAADALGGGRVALRYPGNRELLVNAVAWLAGREDLVASAGAGREVNRLPRLSRAERLAVSAGEAFGLPAALAAIGAAVVLRRRWRT